MWHLNVVMRAIGIIFFISCSNGMAGSTACFLCIDGEVMFPLDINGPSKRPPKKEVCANRIMLAEFNANTFQQDMDGGILFDGVIQSAGIRHNRRQEIIIQVAHVLFGTIGSLEKKITVISPLERDGGVSTVIGEEYRIYVVPIEGRYYTWALTGSAPTDPIFSDFYQCK